MARYQIIILTIVSALLAIIALFFIWLQVDIFNTDRFADKMRSVFQSEQVSGAISSEIVTQSLEGKPVVQAIAGNPLEKIIGGLIQSNRFGIAIERLAQAFQMFITSERQEAIQIDVTGIKNFIQPVISQIDPALTAEVAGLNIPDQITVVNPRDLPTIYPLSQYLWIGPVAITLSLAILALMIYFTRRTNLKFTLKFIGAALIVAGFLTAAILPSIGVSFTNKFPTQNMRVFAETTYQTFTNDLLQMYVLMASIGLFILVLGFWIPNRVQEISAAGRRSPRNR